MKSLLNARRYEEKKIFSNSRDGCLFFVEDVVVVDVDVDVVCLCVSMWMVFVLLNSSC